MINKIKITIGITLITLSTFGQTIPNIDSLFVVQQIEKAVNEVSNKFERSNKNLKKQVLKMNKEHLLYVQEASARFTNYTVKMNNEIGMIQEQLDSSTYSHLSLINKLDVHVINLKRSLDSIHRNEVLLKNKIVKIETELNTTSKELVVAKDENLKNKKEINNINIALTEKQQYGLIIIGFALILILTVYLILSNKWNKNTKLLAKKQKQIFEKQIEDGIQLAAWLSSETAANLQQSGKGEIDHSFAKRVADEIVRITTNLSRMDTSIKGYKQLAASVRKLEQSLNANQYELEKLLNKAYDNGMNLQASFVIDESLKEGESIITRIIKPQINYKGKLIQAAQVEVSQGQ